LGAPATSHSWGIVALCPCCFDCFGQPIARQPASVACGNVEPKLEKKLRFGSRLLIDVKPKPKKNGSFGSRFFV
jgi:hypothetical protein